MYNGGNLREGITCTGRWYSDNAQKKHHPFLVIKRSPEFEYQGNRYVRFIPSQTDILGVENDENVNRARWLKVESVPCIIRNWNSLTPDINPAGNGKDTFFELETKDLICGNIPCYPRITKEDIEKGIGWANSPIRRFLNDVVAEEIFNPSREPVIEYTMLDWEKKYQMMVLMVV